MKKWEVKPDMYYKQSEVELIFNAVDSQYFRELNKPRCGKAKTWKTYRMLTYFSFLTGLRAIEMTRVKVKDIDLRTNQLLVHSAKKQRESNDVIWIEDRLIPVLKDYIKDRSPDSYLFGDTKQLTTSCLQKSFKQILELVKSSVNTVRSLHATRHSYASYYYRKTLDLRATQLQLRHESPNMTAKYAVPMPEDMERYSQMETYKNIPTSVKTKENNVVMPDFKRAIA